MKKIIYSSLVLFMMFSFMTTKVNAQFLTVKFFLSGYTNYNATNPLMNAALGNWNMINSSLMNNNLTDFVEIGLWKGSSPDILLFSGVGVVDVNGMCTIEYPESLNGINVYISVKSRNHIMTFSSTCVLLSPCHGSGKFGTGFIDYDFTTSQSQAWGGNQIEILDAGGNPTGVWGFYGGDIDQDGNVASSDYSIWEAAYFNFGYGCEVANADLNGDGYVDGADYPIWENNAVNFVSSIAPTISDVCGTPSPKPAPNTNITTKGTIKLAQSTNEVKVEMINFTKGVSKITVMDAQGKTILTENIEEGANTKSFNTSSFATGMYLIKVENGGKFYVNKVIIK